ncbi:hypothetical protein D3C72_2163740 [compost metagenome]
MQDRAAKCCEHHPFAFDNIRPPLDQHADDMRGDTRTHAVRADKILVGVLAERLASGIHTAFEPTVEIGPIQSCHGHGHFPVGKQVQRMELRGQRHHDLSQQETGQRYAPQQVPARKAQPVGNECND